LNYRDSSDMSSITCFVTGKARIQLCNCYVWLKS
jgi:hypothetical protein